MDEIILTKITDSMRVEIISEMANRAPLAEITKELPSNVEGREFTRYLTYSTSRNGREKTDRNWVIYSSSRKALYCLPCLLFSLEVEKKSSSELNSTDEMEISKIKYKKLYERFPEHERHNGHKH